MDYIFFARTSFCMGDDVMAPNMQRFEYSLDTLTERKIKEYITKYLSNISFYRWNGYCNGEYVCSAHCDEKKSLIIELNDNWKSMLDEHRVIWFDQHDISKDRFGIIQSKRFTLEKALKLHEETYRYVRAGVEKNNHV